MEHVQKVVTLSDLTAWLKGTCIFSVNMYKNIYVYLYIYTLYHLQSSPNSSAKLHVPSGLSIYMGKRASTTLYHLHSALKYQQRYLLPLISSSYLPEKNSYTTFPCAHHWLFPMEEMKYITSHSSFVLAHFSRALYLWVTCHLDTGENDLEWW